MATWTERWKQGKKLGSGGNGNTYRTTRVDGSDPTVYAIKILHDKLLTNKAKKAQMAREVAKLRKVLPEQWDDVPRIVDAFSEDDEIPFIVMDLIEGTTLEDVCTKGALSLSAAVELTLSLLATVERCHGVGITHRDIKDDNVILRGGDHRRPVLLDFGLSVEQDDTSLTSTEHQVGNRFLALPEHLTPNADKRDARSDLAQCCGILFFALTAVRPMTLAGPDGLQPHRRKEVQETFEKVEPPVLVRLAHVFDIGFRHNIDDRWQSAKDLREALTRVISPVLEAPSPEPEVQSLWTLHTREGKPTGLYFNHQLVGADNLKPFFGSPGKETAFGDLPRDIQDAALSVWSEVAVRPELRDAIRNRHAIDHVVHQWTSSATLKWNQEIHYPTTVESGPSASIEVSTLSAPGVAGVSLLDSAAHEAGRQAIDSARVQLAQWEKQT